MRLMEVFPILTESEAADLTSAAQSGDITIIKVFAIDKGLSMMNDSQRGLLAGLLFQHNTITQEELSRALGVARSTLQAGVRLLREGNPTELAQVGAGARGLYKLSRTVRATRGNGHERRAERARENGELWQHLRGGIEHIGSLPLPAEMARIARNNKQTAKYIDERLPRTIKWLEDFANAWGRSNDPQA